MVHLFATLLQVLEWTIIIDALLSWVVPNKEQFPRSLTSQIADPLCYPFRALIGPERTGGFDLSPIAALLLLRFMRSVLTPSL
jgi:uncharacterized protein YggT (Ycf19 family)